MLKVSKIKQACLFIGCYFLVSTASLASPLNAANEDNKDASSQSAMQQELKAREQLLARLSQQIQAINQDLANEQIELEKLKKSQENFLTQLTSQRAALTEQLRMMYRMGKLQSFKTVLNSDNLNAINRQLHYYHYLNDARYKLVLEVRQTLGILNTNLASIAEHELHLKNLLQAKQNEQAKELRAQKQRSDVISQIAQKSESKQEQIVTLMANQKALQDMLDSLDPLDGRETLIPGQSFDRLYGKLEWPLKGSITPLSDSLEDQHKGGYLIHAQEGSPVHAVYGGKVIFASWLRGFGLLVIINHGNGFMSLYAHNHALFTKAGEKVSPRDVIATIGKSDGNNKPSLYFEIRRNGVPVDASQWCHTST